ncbi:dynamin family protein [Hyphomicrobium sp.]|uniref:dynamin family protein n=1 Tax=Hyphomicrobium sp. TaxID=82 RepID=UPI0025C5993F|nr:dynamin family protein [Hyphomicrobium sp.]MCC7251781.1 dynamin family protein [Hyphomicrobium sp.]
MHATRSGEDVYTSGRIGARLEGLRQQLLSCGDVLAGLVEPSARPLIADALHNLRQLECRIAVVGQIKSGKSSFINALVRNPRFLPTNVTPWTTAVTNLHFGQPSPGGYAAVFTFLQRTEWDQLAEGGGTIRELTERLVPDFEPQLLQQHADMLRVRAKERLGDEFEKLLGQAHFFLNLDPGTLEHYVCSGDFAGSPSIGKYSDITKSADIYCQQGPFDFPSTIVDTPGTNDPFLIRDEITRRSLGSADVYIVVLTARQPLSDNDVALLRIMRGLNKDRIVVLINRIDDLSDLDTELPQVVSFVRDKLAMEFPGSSIPVVYGSAWWANQALAFDEDAAARILRRKSSSYLLRAGLLRANELGSVALASADARERMRQSLFAMSGLPAVNQAVDTLMGMAHPTYVLRQITRSFAEMARACESAARSELQILAASGNARRDPAPVTDERLAIYAQERELLAGVAANIEASAAGIEAQLARIIQEEKERLRATLQVTIDTHAARERDVLIDTLSRGRPPRVWTHEGVELRRALANEFRVGFEKAAHRLTSFHARVVPELHKLMRSLVPEPDLADPRGETLAIPTPTIAPLSRMLVLDLETSKWRVFWSRLPSPEASGARIEALIRDEFAPIADELVQLAGNEFHHFSTTTIRWSFGACRNIQHALKRRLELLMADYDAALRPAESDKAAQDRDERLRAQAQRLKDNETLTQHLETLAQYIDTVLKTEGTGST